MASLRKSVNMMCRSCICDSTAYGHCIHQVEACTSFDCPLWDVRPVRNPQSKSWVPWSVKMLAAVANGLGIDVSAVEAWCADPRTRPAGTKRRQVSVNVQFDDLIGETPEEDDKEDLPDLI